MTVSQTSGDPFVDYYAEQSLTETSLRRFRELRDKVLRAYYARAQERAADVLDVGCGPGVLSLLFAEEGHRVTGVDINEALIDIACSRAREAEANARFLVGSADALPVPSDSVDICLAPELLEHVPDWQRCLEEITRVLRPGGVLFLTTTNVLCPVQDEFRLPGYSWYPGAVKRRCIELARTRHPEWVNHATYPAFHWFSFFQLQRELEKRGFACMDRFDTADPGAGRLKGVVRQMVQRVPGARFVGHVFTPYTQLIAVRRD
ncbi:class I SAM-dependent methyltransferase [Aquisalimonas sp. APHAB1-3]|uniref:class I SAM-dependent methyltransferase n=1 Tax=Aquisalimonas sp. APHAB1-3 TaxID=3402080 RepID=UPI003AB058F2